MLDVEESQGFAFGFGAALGVTVCLGVNTDFDSNVRCRTGWLLWISVRRGDGLAGAL